MKTRLGLLAFLMGVCLLSKGQTLLMYPRFGGAHFEYTKDTVTYQVSPKQVTQILYEDPLALEEFKKAKSKSTLAGIIGFTGGVMIGFPLGTALAGGQPEWGLAAGGAALIIATFPLTASYKRHAQNACNIYNKNHSAFKPKFEYYFSGLGARVILKF